VVKTQGRRGEVASEILSDIPDRFAVGMKMLALPRNSSSRRELEVEGLWLHKGLLVLKFAGVDSISEAEELVGSELQVPRSQRSQLEAGWNYVSDLVGCALLDHGSEIGRIEDVQSLRRGVPGNRGCGAKASADEFARRPAGSERPAHCRRETRAGAGSEKRH